MNKKKGFKVLNMDDSDSSGDGQDFEEFTEEDEKSDSKKIKPPLELLPKRQKTFKFIEEERKIRCCKGPFCPKLSPKI